MAIDRLGFYDAEEVKEFLTPGGSADLSDSFEAATPAGTTAQYWRGDKTWQTLDKAAVGLGSADNTADAAKAVLSATKLTTARNIDGQAFNGTADITVIAPGTHAATSKATPADADELPLVDTAASNVLKKLTWANLKTTLKTYLDTLYGALGTINTWSGIQTFSAVPVLAGGAIHFPATQVPSADVNDLDDYEEGTFTVTLLFGGASTGITYSTQIGRYTKIGRFVFIEIRLVLTSKGSATGTATIGTLPFTGLTQTPFVIQLNNVAGLGTPSAGLSAAFTAVSMSTFNGATLANLTDANFANNSVISVSGFYATT